MRVVLVNTAVQSFCASAACVAYSYVYNTYTHTHTRTLTAKDGDFFIALETHLKTQYTADQAKRMVFAFKQRHIAQLARFSLDDIEALAGKLMKNE